MAKTFTVNWTNILERAILGKLIETLLEAGHRLEISDQDGGDNTFVYIVPDDGRPANGYSQWVMCVPGNGPDFISDFTANLEKTLAPVEAFCAIFRDGEG